MILDGVRHRLSGETKECPEALTVYLFFSLRMLVELTDDYRTL